MLLKLTLHTMSAAARTARLLAAQKVGESVARAGKEASLCESRKVQV